jgi:DNA-directed RNA polymerase specialized sigma24 family protein
MIGNPYPIDPPFARLIRGGWFAKVVLMSERVMSERVMPERSAEPIRELLDSLYRVDSGRILATLIHLLGDFDLAEEAMHEAFAAALSLWPSKGVPGNPRPWLISTARFKAIDTLRRRARFDASQMANWPIITWRIPPVPICTAGSAGQLRLALHMRRRWR